MSRMRLSGIIAGIAVVLAGCATPEKVPPMKQVKTVTPERRAIQPITGPALVVRLLPAGLEDRSGWADDIHASMTRLGIEPSAANVCAVVAVTEQESGFRVDPPVPNLAGLARKELERRRERAGIPKLMLRATLALPSSDGRSYRERLSQATTERHLSDLFEDLAGRLPMAKAFLDGHNPVRTGGPMQVGIGFAESYAASVPYPYEKRGSVRDEVFTRRGGLYFGIAHLLDYRAPYEDPVYRFADYNAGRFASRNAAFQKALGELAGTRLELDGDLAALTERAALKAAARLHLSPEDVRRDLALGRTARFEQSRLYTRVFELAGPAPRAVLPEIVLRTPKTTRMLTTDGFARRVAERYRACLARL